MNSEPLVSIIIPFYNSEKHLEETILSCIYQSWDNKEILLVDNGSTDKSYDIASKYEGADIKLLKEFNKGASAARNHGLKHSKGSFIQFLDSDDLLSPNKIELQLKSLRDFPYSLAVCDTVHFADGAEPLDAEPSPYENAFLYSSDKPIEFLINLWGGNGTGASMVQTNAWLLPRDILNSIGYWEEFYSPDDDGEFFARAILASQRVIYTPGCFNYYRKFSHGSNLSSRNNKAALEGCYRSILLKKAHLLSKTNDPRASYAIAKQLFDLAVIAYPNYGSLSKQILAEISILGKFKFPVILGGAVINFIGRILGWKIARVLSSLKNSLLK